MDGNTFTPLHCPSCSEPMYSLELRRRAVGKLAVDLCFGCCLIWFDQGESAQLAPAAVIELFREIQARRDAGRSRVSTSLSCPRCTQGLTLTHDICKSGPIQYFRCPEDGGRLTPFFQFLREKQFLRALTPTELHQVRVKIKQLQCSNCGAPIDLEHSTSCPYCGSPVAMLDADAVKDAMQMWVAQDTRERVAEAQAANWLQTMSETSPPQRNDSAPRNTLDLDSITGMAAGSDLVQACIAALGDVLTLKG
jgi:uncharacterized Zn finger protein (UPF0148 family)/Zn-finger nucleic acid-binding protein